ncbi:hypothetical protein E2C01_045546 [Portunus trituberculatus]|uniref:Uncharacterized protein n=1 Tax=Portunus trituberculatus TaxID=210409 RepID=A0A5B7G5B8_PORTR|nr:hypothetical protein [Portunus trituberculatus]
MKVSGIRGLGCSVGAADWLEAPREGGGLWEKGEEGKCGRWEKEQCGEEGEEAVREENHAMC